RLNYPQRTTWGDFTAGKTYARAFDPPDQPYTDTGALAYRGVMVNQDSSVSYFESEALRFIDPGNTNATLPDSFARAALNYTTNPTNRFGYVGANNVGYWYDWNFNYDGAQPAGTS